MNILQELRNRFRAALVDLGADPAFGAMVKPAQDARFGDYQANCAMPLAKQRGGNARDVAAQIVERLSVADLCESPEIAGPGFINLRLKADWLVSQVNGLVADQRLGVVQASPPRRIVVDYSSPNVAKPMHVGHLRSTVIGDALYRILKFQGHTVTGDNHVGDWGTQFGMIIYGYKNFLDQAAFERNTVAELARLYRLVNQLADYHEAVAEVPKLNAALSDAQSRRSAAEAEPVPQDKKDQEARKKALKRLAIEVEGLQEQVTSAQKKKKGVEESLDLTALAQEHPRVAVLAREETARLHAGDAENLALWQQFMPACLAAINSMYSRLGVHFDTTLGESFFQPFLASVVESLQAKGIAKISDGAVCVFIPGVEAPFIVRKTDGAFTYATTDLATIQYRVETLGADTMLYVVDARQSDHFRLLFETARRWGFANVDFRHVSFGTILDEKKQPYKTRSGDTVGLESLLDESVVEARKVVDSNQDVEEEATGSELNEDERARIAEAVGIGAIKYADLSQNRESDYVFSWAKMLNKKGDTATYLQYAFARVCGIFRKGGFDRNVCRAKGGRIELAHLAERALALQIVRFSEALDDAAAESRPNFLTNYLFETANCFSTFYEQCPVLKAEVEESVRASRLLLADLTARVLSQGLDLLGIQTIEQM
jgi:arginyl-tRNA synthetase